MSRYTFPSLPAAPKSPHDSHLWLQKSYNVIWNATRGKMNCVTNDLTLATGTVTTALRHPWLAGASFIQAMALTAAAAAEPTLWYSNQDDGVATVNHTSSADADRTFRFLIIG